jgi:hypothetical protein
MPCFIKYPKEPQGFSEHEVWRRWTMHFGLTILLPIFSKNQQTLVKP